MTFEPTYADEFNDRLSSARDFAEKAKKNSGDPREEIEIPVAEDMAERCEKLLEREYGDKIHGLADNIRRLENSDEIDGREEMSLELAEEFAVGDLSSDFTDDAKRTEAAIRTSIAILTEGVVAAPIEGIGTVEIDNNDDGSKFIRIPYFGPIRSAGGTAQAVSVLVADYVRECLDISEFKPRDDEVERYVEEIELYDNAIGMQYCPDKEEGRYIVRNTPIMVDGIPNSNAVSREVDGYRDLERIEGNHPRDGMCLVMAEGIGLKAPKLQRYSEAFNLSSWDWLDKLIEGGGEDDETDEESGENDQISSDESDGCNNTDHDENSRTELDIPISSEDIEVPGANKKYMKDAIAGRPIFCGPSEPGGFRLRYGRARNTGHASVGFSPASMIIVDEFIAPSTQLKTERPGKAAGASPVDSIDGPVVRLKSGEVIHIHTEEKAKDVLDDVESIVDLGEIAVPYGEFVENNHPLAPASYVLEWWIQDAEKYGVDISNLDIDSISAQKALEISEETGVPLHPDYTYLWHDIGTKEYAGLRGALDEKEIVEKPDTFENFNKDEYIKLPNAVSTVLEKLLVPHIQHENNVYITEGVDEVLEACVSDTPTDNDVLLQVNESVSFSVRPRAPTKIGARMGRPEKAERRELSPSIHSLFPIKNAGGDERRIERAARNTDGADYTIDGKGGDNYDGKGVVSVRMTSRICPECELETWKMKCPDCEGVRTEPNMTCGRCGKVDPSKEEGENCRMCGGEYGKTSTRDLDVYSEYISALENVSEREQNVGKVKGVKRLTSKSKIPEPLEKGILRAKHNVSVFRDGTARYDMCDLPLTAVKPDEIGISVDKMKDLGYEKDIHGNDLTDGDDITELKMQDVIINEEAAEYILDVSNYIDDLLVEYYDMEPYYNADNIDDLVGSLVIGMAPHTSAGVLGRIIGFTDASANYAHPFFHAAKRRNCFHPETELTVRIDKEWKRISIKTLVETYLTDDADDSYDDGSVVQSIDDVQEIDEIKVPSMNDDGTKGLQKITHLSKHLNQEHLIEIEINNESTIKVTQDHNVPIIDTDDGSIETIPARNITEGQKLYKYEKDDSYICSDPIELDNPETFDDITSVNYIESDADYLYNVTVENTNRLVANGYLFAQCDGDEDSVMLLMDGLLNFSRKYLPDQRGKNMMDAPIVMSSVIDPEEIDDEAHNVDIQSTYPRSFYEKTIHGEDPDNANIEIAEERLDEPTGFLSNFNTSDINAGPSNTAYKTLGGMDEKTDAQLHLSEKTRGIKESKVASLVVKKHFFPDIIGNLTAFSRQEMMCRDCGTKHRRAPANGNCLEDDCDGNVSLTVYEGMVDKYVPMSDDLVKKYGLETYTEQRLEILTDRIESLFEDDISTQMELGDF